MNINMGAARWNSNIASRTAPVAIAEQERRADMDVYDQAVKTELLQQRSREMSRCPSQKDLAYVMSTTAS
ncbi:hypothetical protein MRB53_038738 [Persea americana]|nr:hypothetical protein MRB53_038738 [Persea americana]